jgi:hypothetical protein
MSRSAPRTRTRSRLPRPLSALAALAAAVATSCVAAAGLTAQKPALPRTDTAAFQAAPGPSLLFPSTVLTALELGERQPAIAPQSLPAPAAFRPPTGSSILGGTLGSAVGVVGGALVGYSMRTCGPGEWFCGMGEAMVGALAGSVVGSTVGANMAARRGGATPTFGSTVLAGAAGVLTGALGSALGAQMDRDSGFGVLLGWSLGQGIVTGLVAAKQR